MNTRRKRAHSCKGKGGKEKEIEREGERERETSEEISRVLDSAFQTSATADIFPRNLSQIHTFRGDSAVHVKRDHTQT